MNNEKKALNIKVDAELAKQFKIAVTANNTTIQNVLTEMIRQYIEASTNK